MTSGRQAECRAPEAVRGGVIGGFREPAGEDAEIGRTVRAPGPAFVEQANRVDQLLDGRHRRLPQQPRLGRMPGVAGREPVAQPPPPVQPRVEGLLLRALVGSGGVTAVGNRVGRLPARGEFQQPFVPLRFELGEQHRDLRAGVGQVGDELVDVVDQAFLVCQEAVDVAVGEVDRAAECGHERLRVVGQGGEPFRHGQQEQVDLAWVGVLVLGEGC